MTNYTLSDVKIPRDYWTMPEVAQGYLVEYELYALLQQLRTLNLSSKQVFELLAGTLFAHDMRQAHNFLDVMYLVVDKFRSEQSARVALVRHLYAGGNGIHKIRTQTRFSQTKIYRVLAEWHLEIERGACYTNLTAFIADKQFIANLDKLLVGMRTFGDYGIRENVSTRAIVSDRMKRQDDE